MNYSSYSAVNHFTPTEDVMQEKCSPLKLQETGVKKDHDISCGALAAAEHISYPSTEGFVK